MRFYVKKIQCRYMLLVGTNDPIQPREYPMFAIFIFK